MERLSLEDNVEGQGRSDNTNVVKNEEKLTVGALSLLLVSCLKPGLSQNGAIERILEILQTGRLDSILLSPPLSEQVDWISDLVRWTKTKSLLFVTVLKIFHRLPDRTLGLLSRPEQGKLPDLLQHQHYCEILQRTICAALASFNSSEKSISSTTHLPILFSCLISTHPHHLTHHLWTFLAAFSLTSSVHAALISAIMSSLDSMMTEKVSSQKTLASSDA